MRTEDVLEAIETLLTGLTTTTTNVKRAQVYDVPANKLPFLAISGGEDIVDNQLMQSFIDWNLTVFIDVLATGTTDALPALLNTIRGEVHAALMGDFQLSLAYVHFVAAVTSEQPEISVDGDKPIAKQRLTYMVKYRTNWANFN